MDSDKKTEAKNMENTTPLPEDRTMMEDANEGDYELTPIKCGAIGCDSTDTGILTSPQGKIVIGCNKCGRTLCGDVMEFDNLMKAWNKGSARP